MGKIISKEKIQVVSQFKRFGERCILLEQKVLFDDGNVEFRCTYLNDIPLLWNGTLTEKIESTATIYKVMANVPILTNYWISKIKEGKKTKDEVAWGQALRKGKDLSLSFNDRVSRESLKVSKNEIADTKFVLDKDGKVQYVGYFFSNSDHNDIDLRGNNNYPEYISPEIAKKLKQN